MRRLDPAPAAVCMLGLVLVAEIAGRHDPRLRRLLLRGGVSLVLFGYTHVKAHVEGRDDHPSHLAIGAAAIPVGIASLIAPTIAAAAVIGLAVVIVLLELNDPAARQRGARWTLRAHCVRIDFTFGAAVGVAAVVTAPGATGTSPGPLVMAIAGVTAIMAFGWLCAQTTRPVGEQSFAEAAEAQAAKERMLATLDPDLAATLRARLETAPATAPSPALVGAEATSAQATPRLDLSAHGPLDTSRSVPPPGWRA